ncbi:MAG: hypothetical protein KKB50_05430 [Planctomycetes bacterium]|nr:hypothetical protein [Planctomycetota bacterium]
MASRTQIVCLCEGAKGASIDAVFINKLMRTLRPGWIRPAGTNYLRIEPCGGRKGVIAAMPDQLRHCLDAGSDTTLMVWADCDDDCANGDALKDMLWKEADESGITRDDFDRVVFILPKDRIENWIEFLTTGNTDESKEGPRVRHNRNAADAAKKLALMCRQNKAVDNMPPSLQWSCKNWRALVERMKQT